MKIIFILFFLLTTQPLYVPVIPILENIINKSIKVTVTVYNAVESQTNSDPFHTASMFHIDSLNPFKHKIIAVSRDLLNEFPNGTKVIINGN